MSRGVWGEWRPANLKAREQTLSRVTDHGTPRGEVPPEAHGYGVLALGGVPAGVTPCRLYHQLGLTLPVGPAEQGAGHSAGLLWTLAKCVAYQGLPAKTDWIDPGGYCAMRTATV